MESLRSVVEAGDCSLLIARRLTSCGWTTSPSPLASWDGPKGGAGARRGPAWVRSELG